MFWGLIMEPNKRYSQTVDKAFHVSMATLDISTADDQVVQVMVCYEGRNYLLCNLKKGSHWQMPLDLNFQEGTTIAFTSNGRGYVHMTGYLLPEDDVEDFEDDEEEEEEEDDEEEEEEEVPQLSKKSGKRKALESPLELKQLAKKLKAQKQVEESSDDDEVDDDEQNGEDNSLEIEAEGDSDEESEEEDNDEQEEEDSDEDEEEAEVEVEVVQPQKKNKQQQQQQQQKNQKNQKQQNNLTNGKEAKSKQQTKDKSLNQSQNAQQVPKKRVAAGGVQIEELKVGSGKAAKSGALVSVYYVGKLLNGKKFDSTQNGEGFKFRLGKSEVIKGWDVGLDGMQVGGKRRLTIPPGMAYGAKGAPPSIPSNSTLVFDVELRKIK